jgi:hypothetical protein
VARLRKAVKALTDQDVYIGIPEDKAARKAAGDAGISNAYLGYIHEFGAPSRGIPPRPHLIPGIEDIRTDAAAILETAAARALEGKETAVAAALNKIGLLGQNAARARFAANDWPPLKPRTLARKAKGRVNPLIDTGQLRKAYTYVIRKAGERLIVK